MSYRILIVDDDIEFSAHLSDLLRTRGYEVIVQNYSGKAFSTIKFYRPDLVILDLNMPVSGSEVAAQMKEDRELWNTPVVFVTGLLTPDEESQNHHMVGEHPFFAKPFRTEDLLRCVEELIDQNHPHISHP